MWLNCSYTTVLIDGAISFVLSEKCVLLLSYLKMYYHYNTQDRKLYNEDTILVFIKRIPLDTDFIFYSKTNKFSYKNMFLQ
jgi:hypothetical protein